MNDLEFIRKHVKVWPKGAESVRLDRDGEICFKPEYKCTIYDFYPRGYDVSMFSADVDVFGLDAATGINRNYAQWLGEQDLTTLDVPFGELDRDTQLRLVNHVLDGGITDNYFKGEWAVSNGHERKLLCFCNDRKYRAVAKQVKQPTELETLKAKLDEQWLELQATIEQMERIK